MSTPDVTLPTPEPASTRRRWAVPVAVAATVALGVATPALVASARDSSLPPVPADELVASVLDAGPTPLQGTAVYTARLGLPDLPVTELDGADPLALLSGSSTLRVWTDGESRARVALLGSTSEYSVVHDGPEAWTYSSTDDEVVHYVLDEAGRARYDRLADADAGDLAAQLPTPQEAAERALAKAGEHANVSVDAPTTVAGRDAYQLVLVPTDEGTLVDRVVLAVDAETRVPLRYQAWSVSDPDAPALELGFTDVTFRTPDDDVLTFTPPAGATVREVEIPTGDATGAHGPKGDPGERGTTVTGEGWATVVEVTGVDVEALVTSDPAALAGPDKLGEIGSERAQALLEEFRHDGEGGFDLDTGALYEQLTTEVPQGRLLASTLLSVLVTDDGRVLVGSVPPEVLQDAA